MLEWLRSPFPGISLGCEHLERVGWDTGMTGEQVPRSKAQGWTVKQLITGQREGCVGTGWSLSRADAAMVRSRLVVRIPGLFPASAAHWLCGLEQGLSSLGVRTHQASHCQSLCPECVCSCHQFLAPHQRVGAFRSALGALHGLAFPQVSRGVPFLSASTNVPQL